MTVATDTHETAIMLACACPRYAVTPRVLWRHVAANAERDMQRVPVTLVRLDGHDQDMVD